MHRTCVEFPFHSTPGELFRSGRQQDSLGGRAMRIQQQSTVGLTPCAWEAVNDPARTLPPPQANIDEGHTESSFTCKSCGPGVSHPSPLPPNWSWDLAVCDGLLILDQYLGLLLLFDGVDNLILQVACQVITKSSA